MCLKERLDGKVLERMDVVRKMEAVGSEDGDTSKPVVIKDCGMAKQSTKCCYNVWLSQSVSILLWLPLGICTCVHHHLFLGLCTYPLQYACCELVFLVCAILQSNK